MTATTHATRPATAPAPAGAGARGRGHRGPRELGAGAALVLAGVVGWALVRTYPSYDSYFALDWGRRLLAGHLPDYKAYAAPTPHPLWTAIGALCSLLGSAGDRALVLMCVLSLAALVWGVARLGAAVWDVPRGLVAAALVGTSFAFLLYTERAYVDVPFVALVAWAGALEQERPRRGALVMALLALAGLLRPEAWLLALAYWVWLGRGRRGAKVTALALAAPLLWIVSDLIVTGDPLWSSHRTSFVVEAVGQDISARQVPHALAAFLGSALRPPVALLGVLGVVAAVAMRGVRALAVPLALLIAGVVAFAGGAVFVLTAQQRYLTVPAMALALFAAHALLGFRDLPAGDRRRRPWAMAAAVVAVASLAVGAALLPGAFDRLRTELRFVRSSHDALASLLRVPAVRRCRPVVLPTYKVVPDARWVLDAPPGAVLAAPALRGPAGVRIYVSGGDRPIRRLGIAAGVPFSTNAPDPRLPVIARRGPFTARGGCA